MYNLLNHVDCYLRIKMNSQQSIDRPEEEKKL